MAQPAAAFTDLLAACTGEAVHLQMRDAYGLDITADLNLAAGEQVHWLPRRRASDLALPGDDFWLFDDQVVLFDHFTGTGDRHGTDTTTDPTSSPCAPPPSKPPGNAPPPTPTTSHLNPPLDLPACPGPMHSPATPPTSTEHPTSAGSLASLTASSSAQEALRALGKR